MTGPAAIGDRVCVVATGERGFVCGFYPADIETLRVFVEPGVFVELDRAQLEREESRPPTLHHRFTDP